MFKKNFFVFNFVALVLISLFSSISIVIASTDLFGSKFELIFKSTDNVFPDSLKLNSIKLVVKSSVPINEKNLSIDCSSNSRLISNKDNLYLFETKILDHNCKGKKIFISNPESSESLVERFKLITDRELIEGFLDYDDEYIKSSVSKYKNLLASDKMQSYLNQKDNLNLKNHQNYLKAAELEYVLSKIDNILSKRSEKYTVPVAGNYGLPKVHSKLPNTGRPYRKEYTDGIHHGWDIDAPLGAKLVAIDDGIIINVVNDFEDADFKRIDYSPNLTAEQKLQNLDILRGNQVWLKTMKGDVIFYSHLDGVFSHIQPGTVVSKGSPIGTVGVSGIPGYSDYHDYHLHFALQKNPYNHDMAGKYTLLDYMKWDWYFKGESRDYILENQGNIFE